MKPDKEYHIDMGDSCASSLDEQDTIVQIQASLALS
jgi:hypothetical protein